VLEDFVFPGDAGSSMKAILLVCSPEGRALTSRIERHNLTVRMETRRFARLMNAFSKKWEKLHAALALYFAYYKFCRTRKTPRCTPAMAAGVVDHLWTLERRTLGRQRVRANINHQPVESANAANHDDDL
jgi:hypothetical protein